MPRVSVLLSQEEYKQLAHMSVEVDRSLSWLSRLAVRRLLDAYKGGQLPLPLETP